jgi:hypothetical protein
VPALSSCAHKDAAMNIVTTPASKPEKEIPVSLPALEGRESVVGIPFHLQLHENGTCVWEGDVTFTSPTTIRIGDAQFSCESISTNDGVCINVEDAKSMLTNMGVRAEGGLKLHADLGSITLDEHSLARAGQSLDTSAPEDAEVWVHGIPCRISHPLSMKPMERTVSGRFRRLAE